MNNIIPIRYDMEYDEHYLYLYDILSDTRVNIEDVHYYSLDATDKGLIIKFYDKDKNIIKVE